MKKYFVISDVHSHFTPLKEVLDRCNFNINNKEHIFVSCGDLLDRGDESRECLEFVNSLHENRKILICGNHEDLLYDAILRGYFQSHDYHNQTVKTCADLCGIDFIEKVEVLDKILMEMPYNKELEKYYDSLKNYAEIDDFICVHGWLPLTSSGKNVKRNISKCTEKDWKNARWLNGMLMWQHDIKPPKNKTVICGHWHTSFGNYYIHDVGSGEFTYDSDFSPFIDNGIIALDACTAYTKKVNCIVIEDNKLIMVNGESYDNK